jgi:hypothetical protein
MDNHLKALKMLLALHPERYAKQIVPDDIANMLTNMGTEFARLKDEQNVVVHTCWTRRGQEGLSGLPSRPATMAKSTAFPQPQKTLTELNGLADAFSVWPTPCSLLHSSCLKVDEVQHAQSQSQVQRPRLPEIQKEPEGPHRPSRE